MKTLERLLETEVATLNTEVVCMTLSRRFASVYAVGTSDGFVYVYLVGSNEPLMVLQGVKPGNKVCCLEFNLSEDLLLGCFSNGDICVWDLEGEIILRHWTTKSPSTAATFHLSGTLVALLSATQIELWELRNSALAHVYPLNGNYSSASTLSFSPDGQFLVCGAAEDGKSCVLVFELSTGSLTTVLQDAHDTGASICALAFHPLETVLCTGSTSGKVVFWDFTNRSSLPIQARETSSVSPVQSITWTNDGTYAMTMVVSEVCVWNTASLNTIQVAETLNTDNAQTVGKVCFGFDSFAIVTRCSGSVVNTYFYNLQTLGFCTSGPISTKTEPVADTSNNASSVEPDSADDDLLMMQIGNNKAVYTLRNRLDHLKSFKSVLVARTGPNVWQALQRQATATRPELLGELLAGRIIESVLNITPETVAPSGLTQQAYDELANFFTILNSTISSMSEAHQLTALNYLKQLLGDIGNVCPERFEVLLEELDKLTESNSASIGERAREVRSLIIGSNAS